MSNTRYIVLFFLAINLGPSIGMAQTAYAETVERGRYLVTITGCNDCHTAGYLASEGQTPEEQWLTGDTFGWRGPWGTTYGPNLRIVVQAISEDQWVTLAKNLTARPTMPWFALRKMKDEDLRAMYQFIRHLGPGGEPAPAYVPPDQEPDPPYALFPPPPPE
jgi:mono/diheme cytochrome c family protein